MSLKPIAAVIVLTLLTFVVSAASSRAEDDPRGAAQACQAAIPSGTQAFVGCWANQMMSQPQRRVVRCYAQSPTLVGFAACVLGMRPNQDQIDALGCVAQSGGDGIAFAECVGRNYLSFDDQELIDCFQQDDDIFSFGACIAGGRVLTPEQRVIVQCALHTGGEPISLTTCVSGQLTMNELSKCISIGIGGRGCFGDNNAATAFVSNAWRGVSHELGSGDASAATARTQGRNFSSQSAWSWLLSMVFGNDP